MAEERAAQAERARKLLAQRKKKKGAAVSPVAVSSTRETSPAPSSVEHEVEARATDSPETTISLLLADQSALRATLASLQSDLVAARANDSLLAQGRQLVSELEADKAALAEKLGAVQAAAEGVRAVEMERDGVAQELARVRGEAERLAREKAGVEGELAESLERAGEADKALERSREREAGLEIQLGGVRQTNNELTSGNTALAAEVAELRAGSGETETILAELRAAHDTQSVSHASLTSDLGALRDAHTTLSSAHASLVAAHTTDTATIAALESTIAALQSDLTAARSSLAAQTKRADSAEKRKVALQSENEELVQQLDEVRGKVVHAMEESAEMADKVGEWEARASMWEKEQAGMASELEMGLAERKEMQDRIASLVYETRGLASQVSTTTALRAEIAAARAAIPLPPSPLVPSLPDGNGADTELSFLHARIETLESSLHTSTSQVDHLARQLAERYPTSPSTQMLSPTRESSTAPLRAPPSKRLNPIDALPASVRHKRHVSLTALKARMQVHRGDRPVRAALDVAGGDGRRQFGDEIMFCCPACQGDLITL